MNLNTAPEHTTDPDVRHMVIYENLTAGLGGKVALSPWVRGRTEDQSQSMNSGRSSNKQTEESQWVRVCEHTKLQDLVYL